MKVGIADIGMVSPPDVIRTSGLGSCVGVVIYDERVPVAGMVHIMLPDSRLAREGDTNKAKFADTGVSELVHLLQARGAMLYRLKAKMAGGAQMFSFQSQSDTFQIGLRNVQAVKRELKGFRIPVMAEDTGGSNGRTIEFDPATFELHIRTVNKGSSVI